jgi:hypothetical protein
MTTIGSAPGTSAGVRGSALVSSLTLTLLLSSLSSGCFTATPRLNSMASDLEQELDGTRFEKEFGLKLGRLSTGMAKGIAGWALVDGDEEERAIRQTLRGVRRIEVASYETRGDLWIEGPLDFERTLERRGWQTVARLREGDSFTWVLFKEQKGSLTGFRVVALERDELTLVDLRGRLDKTLAAAMQLARSRDTIARITPKPPVGSTHHARADRGLAGLAP